jgi:hypothetical protein
MSVEEIKLALDGAFASEFHRSKPTYLYLASILGDENRIRNHLTRIGTRSEPARPQPVAADADPLPSEQDIAALAGALQANEEVLTAALRVKGWTPGTLLALGVGFDGQRLVFPVRDSEGTLVSVARYASRQKPKMLAPKGRPRDLFPAPETIQGEELWIVEGEPDAVTAHQLGLPAVGVPGAAKWQDDWMPRLAASRVVVCFDCDEAGRRVRSDGFRVGGRDGRAASESAGAVEERGMTGCGCQIGASHKPTCPRLYVVPWIVVVIGSEDGNS